MSKYFKGKKIYHSFDLEQILSFHLFEDGLRNMVWNIEEGDVVMDIGVDFGPYTLTALSQGASHVYAIEPRQKAIERLETNLELNDFTNITIINRAISDNYQFILLSDTSLSSTILDKPRFQTTQKEATFTTTIDNIVSEYKIKKLDWIKIDVEGYEYLAVLGGIGTLKRFGPKLLIENHNTENEKRIHKLLVSLGYSLIHSHKELLYFNDNITHNFYQKTF